MFSADLLVLIGLGAVIVIYICIYVRGPKALTAFESNTIPLYSPQEEIQCVDLSVDQVQVDGHIMLIPHV